MKINWWEGESIRWFLDASRVTLFHKNIAEVILPFLSANDTVCDIGAGLGRLDLFIAPAVKSISAIDTSGAALEVLRRDAARMNLSNIETLPRDCDDLLSLRRRWDVVMMSFFGSLQRQFDVYKKISNKHIIAIVNAVRKGALHPRCPQSYSRPVVADIESFLKTNSVKYNLVNLEVEFGQPLLSVEDGINFIRAFSADTSYSEAEDFIAANAVPFTDEFPLYLPNKKPVGVFVI